MYAIILINVTPQGIIAVCQYLLAIIFRENAFHLIRGNAFTENYAVFASLYSVQKILDGIIKGSSRDMYIFLYL